MISQKYKNVGVLGRENGQEGSVNFKRLQM